MPVLDLTGLRTQIHTHGFVRVVDVMPRDVPEGRTADYAVTEAARVSYGGQNKTPEQDAALLRYMMRHKHWTPFEMCEVKWHVSLPIFVARQWIRHRTACLAGDVKLHFDLPGGVQRRNNQKYTLSVRSVFQKFQPTANRTRPDKQRNPFFKRDRVRQMLLRCMDEASGKPSHTRIVDVWESGIKPVYDVILSNGSSCRMSADHRCLTSEGWRRLRDVAVLPDGRSKAWRCEALFASIGPGRGPGVEQRAPELDEANEKWKPVVGWEGLYEVSTQGRVRRIAPGRGARTGWVKRSTLSAGRPVVSLSRGGRSQAFHVHTLVLTAFGGPCPEGKECCHNNGNAMDCRVENLRWDTIAANSKDRVRHGGTTRLDATFTPVSEIRYAGEEMTYDLEVEGPWHNFVAGGMVVHNSVNEVSARYTELPDRFYVPEDEGVGAQSTTNRQGREGSLPSDVVAKYRAWLALASLDSHEQYQHYTRAGVSRELARLGLPVNVYTEWYWKCDLRNTLAFLHLRADAHAQQEIREYATAMIALLDKIFPVTMAAFRDYALDSLTLTAYEVSAVQRAAKGIVVEQDHFPTPREYQEWLIHKATLGL